MTKEQISGYTYGTAEVAKSPLSEQEFALLKQSVLFTDEDLRYLRMAGEVLEDQVEKVLDVWYGFVSGADGTPNPDYLAAVRKRFGQWIRDTCAAKYDRAWLDYQHEIGLRHTRAKKNQTDNVRSAAEHIHLRYLIAFIYPITATIKPFLANKGHKDDEVEKMHQAWFKSVVLQVTLWSVPYTKPGDF